MSIAAASLACAGAVLAVAAARPHASPANARALAGARTRARAQPLMSCPPAVRALGRIAFAARGRLELVDLRACRVRRLATGAAGDVRFSADGRWLGYAGAGGGGPVVIPAGGGPSHSPLGPGILDWWWAPKGHVVYGLSRDGRVLAAPAGGGAHVVATGVSAPSSAALSPDGRSLAVQSARCLPARSQLATVDLVSGKRRVVTTRPHSPATLAGWSPDGRWLLFWAQAQCSASLSADGWPLDAVRATGGTTPSRAIAHMLLYPDFLTWCGRRLIAAATPSRETQLASRLVATGPPAWRPRVLNAPPRLSWVSPACAPSGTLLAAAAGPSTQDTRFGVQNRSIWLLTPSGRVLRRLTSPPSADLSDEAPRFSRNGRWILFVRSRVITRGTAASSRNTLELVPAMRRGTATPVPLVSFTSGDISFYDHFTWPTEIDWSSP